MRSVRVRLTLWYVALLAVVLGGFGASVYILLRYNLYSSIDEALALHADELKGQVSFQDGHPTLQPGTYAGSGRVGEQFVRLFDPSGNVVFDDSGPEIDPPIEAAAVRKALATGDSTSRRARLADESFLIRTVALRSPDGQIAGVLETGTAAGDADDILRALLLIMVTVYPATLLAASVGGLFLAGRALSPVDRLTSLARSITAQDLSKRLNLRRTDDEIGRLAQTLDDMIGRLDESFQRQRQFTADASHELRTPLTAIKGQVEVGLSKERDAEAYREVLRSVEQETDRLIRLVGSLLMLARADAGQLQVTQEQVAIGDMVDAAREHAKPVAEKRGVSVVADYGPPASVRGDRSLLVQLLFNLVDNAVKYTEPGGKVSVAWAVDGAWALITVRDTGIGISAQHLPHIFDRFYRADSARSRAQGGAGLGLSICRWIAEAHGGSISAESNPGVGSVFTVRLPTEDFISASSGVSSLGGA